MPKNNIYPLVIPPGCGYPQFEPVNPNKLKRRWLPYGKTVTPILVCCGKTEEYFKQRYTTTRAADHNTDEQSDPSYPRIVNDLTREDV